MAQVFKRFSSIKYLYKSENIYNLKQKDIESMSAIGIDFLENAAALRGYLAIEQKPIAPAKESPNKGKKEEKKDKNDDDFDLFGDDDGAQAEAKKVAEQKKAEAGKKKKVVIAKSIIIFDVKVNFTFYFLGFCSILH